MHFQRARNVEACPVGQRDVERRSSRPDRSDGRPHGWRRTVPTSRGKAPQLEGGRALAAGPDATADDEELVASLLVTLDPPGDEQATSKAAIARSCLTPPSYTARNGGSPQFFTQRTEHSSRTTRSSLRPSRHCVPLAQVAQRYQSARPASLGARKARRGRRAR